jgi:hypothetical protein
MADLATGGQRRAGNRWLSPLTSAFIIDGQGGDAFSGHVVIHGDRIP